MSSIVHDFFKKQEPIDDMLGTNNETYHFLKDLCSKLALPGIIDAYYYVKEGDAGHIMVALSDIQSDPDDEYVETEENYEIEFSDFEFVKVGEEKVPDSVEYFRNHKYQDLIKQRFSSESKKLQDSYQSGCNSFNGMRYKEKAPEDVPTKNPGQQTLDFDDMFDELFDDAFDEQGGDGRIS